MYLSLSSDLYIYKKNQNTKIKISNLKEWILESEHKWPGSFLASRLSISRIIALFSISYLGD